MNSFFENATQHFSTATLNLDSILSNATDKVLNSTVAHVLPSLVATASELATEAATEVVSTSNASSTTSSFLSGFVTNFVDSFKKVPFWRRLLRRLVKFSIANTGAVAVTWTLLRFRLMPFNLLYKAWFGGCCVVGFTTVGIVAIPLTISNKIGLLSNEKLHHHGSFVAGLFIRWLFFMNPQMKFIRHYDERKMDFSAVNRGAGLIVNHTSNIDGFIIMHEIPLKMFRNVKSIGKAALRKIPIVGFLLFDLLQYYQVYYNSDRSVQGDNAYNDWSIDKKLQAEEMDRVKSWIHSGKSLFFSPEGRINEFKPDEIQSPRHGMLKILYETKCDMFVLSMYPAHEFWPVGNKIDLGGLPCEIDVVLGKMPFATLDCKKQEGNENSSPTDTTTLTPLTPHQADIDGATLSEAVRVFMQKELDYLIEIRKKRNNNNAA